MLVGIAAPSDLVVKARTSSKWLEPR